MGPERAPSSSSACHSGPLKRPLPGKAPRCPEPRPMALGGASWWSTTTSTRRTRSRSSSATTATRSRRRTTAWWRSSMRDSTDRSSFCSTSACRTWTATRSPAACGTRWDSARPCWLRSPATGKSAIGASRVRPASIGTSPNRLTYGSWRSCWSSRSRRVAAHTACMPGDFDQVKERIDIVQLIGERVALKKAARAYKGLCPFHAEKTPSFTVDPDRRTYHCFGCGEGGDAFTWLEKMDGLEPAEALKVLAERAGVELTSRRAPEEREREKRLLGANETAHFYFRQALRGTESGKAVARYLAERGIQPETSERFGLGYAPDLTDGLLAYVRKKGFTDEESIAAGLVVPTERGLFDRFRDRLMVPIKDGRGRIVAFGGRAMRADQPGKYVNSPQTQLFNKSATLYALDLARSTIRRERAAGIVEGYFHAIALHQAGVANTVASMG